MNLHLNFDPDKAGADASERSVKLLLDENMRVRIVELEDGLDPDEYAKKFGAERYREKVAGAKAYFYWLADRARARFNMREPQGRVDAFQFLLPAIQGLNDKLERVAVANDLGSYLGVESGLVLEHFRKLAADRVQPNARVAAPVQNSSRATDRILLPLLLNDAAARDELIGALRGCNLQNGVGEIYTALIVAHDANEEVSFNALHSRLTPAQQEKLAAIVLDNGETSVA